ncbi:MAG: DNA-binding transcriptional regulator [Pirellulaceae bacterium]|nr:DNA-binding transcriptional regulator [Pirellulaceae bacterium]
MSQRIALLFNLSKTYDRQIAQAIIQYSREKRWIVYLEERPEERLPIRLSRQWDGLIADLDDFDFLKLLRKERKRIPVVVCGKLKAEFRKGFSLPSVQTDDRVVVELAWKHLTERGYRTIAFCSMRLNTPDAWLDDRTAAYVDVAKVFGKKPFVFIDKRKSPTMETTIQELREWISSLPKPLGIIACNDPRARHVYEACRQNGNRLPDEVGIVGVDNSDLYCDLMEPPLTSIQLDTSRIGFELARLLELAMKKNPSLQSIQVPPKGIAIRGSTDLAFSDNPIIANAIRFIRDQLGKAISVKQLCQKLSVSRSTLDAHFRESFGHGAHAEIAKRRLDYCLALLQDTSLSIGEIAARSGFSSPAYFIAVFRKAHGCTPQQYRQAWKA